MTQIIPIQRALLSVSNKKGLVTFARELAALDVEIISTGGTSQLLREANIVHRQVEEITGLPEMLNGRVKTLHPKIHGGILGRRDQHADATKEHGIQWIDLLVVNFYPFIEATSKSDLTLEEAIEYIDIGGPTMARAAAKNFEWTAAIVEPDDYPAIINEIRTHQGLSLATRKNLAKKVFALTSHYEKTIHQYFSERNQEETLKLDLEKHSELRYGENPHQKAYAYRLQPKPSGILSAHQYQGKPLSYNNILDSEAAVHCVNEFVAPACVIVKHANPCGVAQAETIEEACRKAQHADPLSAFGGILALNQPCTKASAEIIITIFSEVLLAPSYSEEALLVLATKPNLRVLTLPPPNQSSWEMKFIEGGVLVQEKDLQKLKIEELQVVTKVQPQQKEWDAMLFAWPVLKHIKSNAILLAKNNATVGVGAGQVSRVDAVKMAIQKAGENIKDCVLASDAFFPFRDSIDHIAQTGIRAIIQPGGSQRDHEVIAACNEYGIAMVFTGKRCFKH